MNTIWDVFDIKPSDATGYNIIYSTHPSFSCLIHLHEDDVSSLQATVPQTKSGHCLLILNYDKHCTEDETNCLLLIRIIVLGTPKWRTQNNYSDYQY